MWDDYIHFTNSDIYVRRLIAFFPQNGYIIFEGYCRIKKDKLPYTTNVLRVQPNTKCSALFDIEIIETYKKDINIPDTKNNGDAEDCEGHISFFPLDIIILRFNMLNVDNKFPFISWNFSVDSRFTFPQDLIQRYLELLDVPEDSYEPYDTREEDIEFYNDYAKIMEKYEDYYKKDFDYIPKPKKTIKDNTIVDVINKWNLLHTKISRGISKDYGNKDFLKDCISFFGFLENKIPFMQKWCADYISNESFEDKIRGWITFGISSVNRQNIPIDFEKHWQLFFRKPNDEPDRILFNDIEFDISYKHYLKIVSDMEKEKSLKYCNISEILDIHKDRNCNGGLICGMCDDQEWYWEKEVVKKYTSMNNIFINRELSKDFIEKWLSGVFILSDKEQSQINYTWPPIQQYYIRKSYYNQLSYLSFGEYISNLIKNRDTLYYTYKIRPKVEFEFINDFKEAIYDYKIPDRIFKEGPNQYNEIFLFLSHIMTYIQYLLGLDEKRCKELIEIFSKLIDE